MGNYEIGIFDAETMNFIDRISVKAVKISDVIHNRNVTSRCIDYVGDGPKKFFGIINSENNTIAGYVSFTVAPGDDDVQYVGVSEHDTVKMDHFYNKEIRIYKNMCSVKVNFDEVQWMHWILGFHSPGMTLFDGISNFSIQKETIPGEPMVTVIDASYLLGTKNV